MPIWSYRCSQGHETEKLILSINEEPPEILDCTKCTLFAVRVEFPQTAPPRLVGAGFYSPSKAGPIVNKHDTTRVIKEKLAGEKAH